MTPEQRSRCMSHVRGKDTKPEMIVRRFLFSKGLRYRVNARYLPGKPDMVFRKYKTVVFVDGCFWHGHDGCSLYRVPKSNVEFWQSKIARNKARDIVTDAKLRELGWRVIRIWECDLKPKVRENTLEGLYHSIIATRVPNITVPAIYATENEEYPAIAAEQSAPYGETSDA